MNNAIQGININHSFGSNNNRTDLFKNLNFSVRNAEVICLFGPSGSGKTTLLKLIAGLINPSGGRIIIRSKRNTGVWKLGYVFQEPRLLPWKSVFENVEIVARSSFSNPNNFINHAVSKALSMVQLPNFSRKYPALLSGGEQQRVAIARAIVINPDILLLDEPLSHLDELTATRLRTELARIFETVKCTVVFATHNPLEAIFFADRIFVLSKKKPTTIKTIVDIKIPRPRSKNLYQKFIFERMTRTLLKRLIVSL